MHSLFRNSLVTLLFFLSAHAHAQDTVVVEADYYRIDETLNLIVVNAEVSALNQQWTDSKSTILLNHYYNFAPNISTLEIGKAYSLNDQLETYTLYFTSLPVITINTPHTIPDDPRVYADFHMAESNGHVIHSDLGIEVRGSWTQTLPKKSYRIEFWEDHDGEDTRDFALLGMRSDDDWDLQAMYNEPLRTHSKTSNDLWMEVHQIYYKATEPAAINGIRSAYVELFLNGSYVGIYTVRERVDNKQLKLKSYNGSIRGELYKAAESIEPVYFGRTVPYDNVSAVWGGFEYEFPDDHIDWTNLNDLVSFVLGSSKNEFKDQYSSYLHKGNLIDYFLFLNLLKAKDNAGKNNYIARYKAGEPYYFIPWDLDGVMGNDWTGALDPVYEGIVSNGLFERLRQDCSPYGFMSQAKLRWMELRADEFAYDSLMKRYTANEEWLLLNGVYEREHMAWPDFSYDASYTTYMAGWLRNRLEYLDDIFTRACEPPVLPEHSSLVFPNPASEFFVVDVDTYSVLREVSITNMNGVEVYQSNALQEYDRIDVSGLAPGVYAVKIITDQDTQVECLVISR